MKMKMTMAMTMMFQCLFCEIIIFEMKQLKTNDYSNVAIARVKKGQVRYFFS